MLPLNYSYLIYRKMDLNIILIFTYNFHAIFNFFLYFILLIINSFYLLNFSLVNIFLWIILEQ